MLRAEPSTQWVFHDHRRKQAQRMSLGARFSGPPSAEKVATGAGEAEARGRRPECTCERGAQLWRVSRGERDPRRPVYSTLSPHRPHPQMEEQQPGDPWRPALDVTSTPTPSCLTHSPCFTDDETEAPRGPDHEARGAHSHWASPREPEQIQVGPSESNVGPWEAPGPATGVQG